MNNIKDYRLFLYISFEKISLEVLNLQDEVFLKKEIKTKDSSLEESFYSLKIFLDKYIFEIEKRLNMYIEDIYLIVNYRDVFSVDLSIRSSLKNDRIEKQINQNLVDLKNQFLKTIGNYEIIHMTINKFIVNGTFYQFLPNKIDNDNILMEVRFFCLQSTIINELKKILQKYQILSKKFFFYGYLKNFKSHSNEDFSITASNIIGGINKNEILLLDKSRKKLGFFEKFFKFFN